MKRSIETIIEDRISTPAIKKELASFGVRTPSLSLLTSETFLFAYNQWTEDKKKKFIKCLGGPVNFNKTKEYIEKHYVN